MKFTSIVNSFKSGKVSRKIKHRQDIDPIKDGCEELSNFILLPNGVLKRRPGMIDSGVFPTLGEGSIYELNYSKDHSYIIYIGKNGTSNGNIFSSTSRNLDGLGSDTTARDIRIFDHTGREYFVRTLTNHASKPWLVSAHSIYSQTIPHDGWNITQFSRKTVFTHSSGLYQPFFINIVIAPQDPVVPTWKAEFQVMPWFVDYDLGTRGGTEQILGDTSCIGGVTTPFPPLSSSGSIDIVNPNGVGPLGGILTTNACIKRIIIPKSQLGGFSGDFSSFIGCGVKALHPTSNKEGMYFLTNINTTTLTTVTYDAICTVEADNDIATDTYTKWTFSYWGGRNKYPSCASAFRGRLVFGGVAGQNNRFFMTAVNANNFFSFQNLQTQKLIQDASSDSSGLSFFNTSVTTDLGISAAFNESNAGEIVWIKGRRILHFGTSTGEFQVSFLNSVVALSNMEVQKVSSFSSSNVTPAEGDQKIIYAANDNSAIRSISTNARDYESTDIAISAMNAEDRNISRLLWVEPYSSLMYISNSKLYGICINEQTQVAGFYDLEYPFDVKSAFVSQWRSLNTDTSTYTDYAYLYLFAKVGTSYKILSCDLKAVDKEEGIYLDAVKFSVTPLSNPSSTMWADKEVVVEYNDGTVEVVAADSSGIVPVTSTDPFASIGIRFKSRLVTTPINLNSRHGQAVGLIKRIDRAMVSVTKSGDMLVGSNNGDLFVAPRSTTGKYEDYDAVVEISNSPDYTVNCVIESVDEYPLNVNSIAYRGVTYEGE